MLPSGQKNERVARRTGSVSDDGHRHYHAPLGAAIRGRAAVSPVVWTRMKRLVLVLLLLLAIPGVVGAQPTSTPDVFEDPAPSVIEVPDTLFRARVTAVLEERETPQPDGSSYTQQRLSLLMHDGPFAGQTVVYDGLSVALLSGNHYKVGDEVVVWWSKDVDGTDLFYVTDYVRDMTLLWMALVFAVVVVAVARWQGVRALVALVISFVVILHGILPAILHGADPVPVAALGALVIVGLGIVLVHGFTRASLVSVTGVALTLLVVTLVAHGFTLWARLSGFGSEESYLLTQLLGEGLNMRGIFLAGVLIGALGVLDDIVVSQVAVVQELMSANTNLTRWELFERAMRVGVDHASAVTNTLFLAYAGASLPLLLLFMVHEAPFLTARDVLNNELVASEVVRTIVGSLGLLCAVPITTLVAVFVMKRS